MDEKNEINNKTIYARETPSLTPDSDPMPSQTHDAIGDTKSNL